MFYFMPSGLMYNFVLIAAAVIPAVILMIQVYKLDWLEKESPQLLKRLVVAGILSALLALVEERVLSTLLYSMLPVNSLAYNLILYFIIVAGAEESSKYIFLKRNTWHNPEFNCLYDGLLYAVFVSLGFALWENISYVMTYGFSVAVVRAVTAIPGHACFGVFMGVFYGIAKKMDNFGNQADAFRYRIAAIMVPALLHGAYDFIATQQTMASTWLFVIFVLILFAAAFYLTRKTAREDRYIS
ncbi:MAG: PrsW family intramembrane metalloprotease [Oscillospiraceae bacterium]|nr:PrsW family intramembrane metalloprotease [Oscillospiraceae bacterium]